MSHGFWCGDCGNELVPMNAYRFGCLPCYRATGPDWVSRWTADSAATTTQFYNVVILADWQRQRETAKQGRRRTSSS